jgi:hypothetical protein
MQLELCERGNLATFLKSISVPVPVSRLAFLGCGWLMCVLGDASTMKDGHPMLFGRSRCFCF